MEGYEEEERNEYDEIEVETSKNEISQMFEDSSMHNLINKKDLTSDQKVQIAKSNEVKRKKMEINTFRDDYNILKAEITVMDKSLGRNVVPRKRAVDQINIIMRSDEFKERFSRGFISIKHWKPMENLFRIDQDVVPELVILNEFLIEGIKQVAQIVDISSTIDSSDRLLTQVDNIVKSNNILFSKILNNATILNDKTIQHHEDKVEKDMNSLRKNNEIANLQNQRKCELLREEIMKLKNVINRFENVKQQKDIDVSQNLSKPQQNPPQYSQPQQYPQQNPQPQQYPQQNPQPQVFPQPQPQPQNPQPQPQNPQPQVFPQQEIQDNFFPPNQAEDEFFENIINDKQPLTNNVNSDQSVLNEEKSNLVPENNEKIFKKVDQNESVIQNSNQIEPIATNNSNVPIIKEDSKMVNDGGVVTSASRIEEMRQFADVFFEKYKSFSNFKKEFRVKFNPDKTENEIMDKHIYNVRKKYRSSLED